MKKILLLIKDARSGENERQESLIILTFFSLSKEFDEILPQWNNFFQRPSYLLLIKSWVHSPSQWPFLITLKVNLFFGLVWEFCWFYFNY